MLWLPACTPITVMKHIVLFFALLSTASAQVPKGQGYLVHGFGNGVDRGPAFGHLAGGGEYAFYKGLGFGAEIGAAYPFRSPAGVFGIASINGAYHFTAGRRDTKWDPFVAAGYSLFFRGDTLNAFNYGGGVVYWVKPRFGIRAEFRDHRAGRGEFALPQFRIGISFR